MYISSSKIVQGERNIVYFNAEPQPIFCKNKENMKIAPSYKSLQASRFHKFGLPYKQSGFYGRFFACPHYFYVSLQNIARKLITLSILKI